MNTTTLTIALVAMMVLGVTVAELRDQPAAAPAAVEASAPPPVQVSRVSKDLPNIVRFYDSATGATCYVLPGTSVSCVLTPYAPEAQ